METLMKYMPGSSLTGELNQHQQVSMLLVVIVITSTFIYYYRKFTFWSSRNIKTPVPLPFFGNILDLIFGVKRDNDIEWRNKYGKVYGYYLGTKPRLVIADADILRRICIKDFHYFPDHYYSDHRNKYQLCFLIGLTDLYWKRVRSLMTPTFTSGKIKRMFKLMDKCSEDMVCYIDEIPRGKPIDVKDLVSLYAMDVITTCCFGLNLDREKNNHSTIELSSSTSTSTSTSRNAFVDSAMEQIKPRILRMFASTLIPNFILRMVGFETVPAHHTHDLYLKASGIINTRRHSARQDHDDYLQLLLNAKLNEKMDLNEMDAKENHHAGLTEQSILQNQAKMIEEINQQSGSGSEDNIRLSELEIVSNSMLFLIVGYETTGTLMSHFLYTLAHHQEVQEKLYEELKTKVSDDGISFDYDTITSAIYLDAVISETLRRMSPVLYMDRVCSQDYYLEDYKMTIPKGTILDLSYHTIMRDPDYWNEPEKFDPSRFLPENRHKIVPGSYCPFGLGPRHCIGMRFSLTESKIGLARLLMKYRFDPVPGTSFPPQPQATNIFLNLHKDLHVLPKARNA